MTASQNTKPSDQSAPNPVATNSHEFRRRLFIQILVLLTVTCGAAVTGLLAEQQLDNYLPETKTLPSVFNRKASGTSGVFEVANKSGIAATAWLFPYRELPTVKGALVIISPSESLAEFEARQILDWVREGNDLVYLDHFAFKLTRRMLKLMNVDASDAQSITDAKITPGDKNPLFAHVAQLTVSADTRLTGAPALLTDKDGGILFATIKLGKGHILLGTVPSLISNRRLTAKEQWANFQFFINWLRTTHGDVFFDERCHGFSRNQNVFVYLARGPTGAFTMQLLLILAVAVLGAAQRFGRLETLVSKRKISNLEFIYGLSNTYKRAKANAATLEIIGQAFRTRVCKILAVSPHESDEHLLEAWNRSLLPTQPLRQAVTQFLTDYQTQMQKRNLSDNELKSLIITCDKITEQIKQLQSHPHPQIERTQNDDKNS
ncbi:MAG TPA: DUF4350 domain-containing protein [Planktothrix sp.]|jgi:hypothetical protein